MCSAACAACAAPGIPLLRDSRLDLYSLEVWSGGPFNHFPQQLVLNFLCAYEDQLGGPVFYDQHPQDIVCTDSTGKVLQMERVVAESSNPFWIGHGDPVRISMALQVPDAAAEWIRLRGDLLCAFADGLEELPPVTLPLRPEGFKMEVPLKSPRRDKVLLSLNRREGAWSVEVAGAPDFSFAFLSIRDDSGLPVHKQAKGSGYGHTGTCRYWFHHYLVSPRARSLQVVVSYWSSYTVRKVPMDMKICLGGIQPPVSP